VVHALVSLSVRSCEAGGGGGLEEFFLLQADMTEVVGSYCVRGCSVLGGRWEKV
jgi:hypothetical protein